MLETEIIKLREAVEALTAVLAAQAQKPTATPEATPEKLEATPDTTPETIPTNQELYSLCASLVRKNPEWRNVIKEHLSARNAVKMSDLKEPDKIWFRDWMTKELA